MNRPATYIAVTSNEKRHDPQHDDPELETDIGQCEECRGAGCDRERMENLLAEFFEPAHGNVCESCGQVAPDASDYGEHICDSCADNAAEAAYERQCEAFHGGDGPMTLREQQIAALAIRRGR